MKRSCRWCQLRMTEYVRREASLTQGERNDIKAHLASACKECRKHHGVEAAIQKALDNRRKHEGKRGS